MNKNILVIKESEVAFNHIENLIKFVFKKTYEYDLSVCSMTVYRNERKKYKNHVIIGMNLLLSNKNKEKIFNKTKIEGEIVRRFLSEKDSKSALIILKNEINKSYLMSKSVIKILENIENEKKISKKKLIDLLSEEYGTKIQFEYIEFILNIVKNYFNFNLSRLSDYFFPSFGL